MNQLVSIRSHAVAALVAAAASMPACASSNSSPPTSATRTRAGPMLGLPRNFRPGAQARASRRSRPVQPVHVATWIEASTRERAAPSVKQRLAAIRHLFDWLVTGQVVPVNPAGSVR
jgi:integrase/recombinase XerC